MIDPKELRLGNWLFFKGEQGQVVSIFNSDIRMADPISLTPEILEKCGFQTTCLILDINEDWFIGYDGEI